MTSQHTFAVPTAPASKRSKPSPLQHSNSCTNVEAGPSAFRMHKRSTSTINLKVTSAPSVALGLPAALFYKENCPSAAPSQSPANPLNGHLSMSMEVLPSWGETDHIANPRPLSFSCEAPPTLFGSPGPKPLLPLVAGSADVSTINAATVRPMLRNFSNRTEKQNSLPLHLSFLGALV